MTELEETEREKPADIAPVIDDLMNAATATLRSPTKTAAMVNAVARLMAEAARLKQLTADAATQPRRWGRLSHTLYDEDELNAWAAKYGPKS